MLIKMIIKFLLILAALSVTKADFNGKSTRAKREDDLICGVRSKATSLIVQGTEFKRGKWPWMVALTYAAPPSNFFCGAVLVGSTKVITAAHCIQDKREETRKRAKDILALFGVHDLTQLTISGFSSASPQEVLLHPNWNPSSRNYDADIAILIMGEDIVSNDFVRPICLPQSQLPSVEKGFVAGWGESEKNPVEKIPRDIEVPIYRNKKCIREAPDFKDICTKNTLCAGSRNDSGVCRGDSGGGLFVISAKIYVLKGIVSASLTDESGKCDVTNFALYTNVEKFINWILNPTEDWIITPTSPTRKKTTTQRPTTTSRYTTKRTTTTATTEVDYDDESHSKEILPSRPACGGAEAQNSLIQNGKLSQRDHFPWTVAIFCKNENQVTEFCSTGTLVSIRHVVTTATVVRDAYNESRNPQDFLMYFGISDLDVTLPRSSRFVDGAARIIVHRKFSMSSLIPTANIAVLVLRKTMPKSEYISPVCIPDVIDDVENYYGRNAFAVGWGQDEDGLNLRVKKFSQMKLKTRDECNRNFKLDLQSPSKFFCAGGNGIRSACLRDHPLYFKIDDRWFLSGLLAQSLMKDGKCDLTKPALYEDIVQHSSWIRSVIDQ